MLQLQARAPPPAGGVGARGARGAILGVAALPRYSTVRTQCGGD